MFKINLAKLHSIHKSILISFLALIVTLIVVYVWFYVYPKQQGEEQVVATRIGIANRLDILQIKGDSIATNPELIQSVASLDANTVQSILFSEKEKSHIPVLSVIDSKGFFISRTLDNGISGDNVFLIAPLGRAMYAGVEKKSVITPGLSDTSKLFFASGRWIYSGSTKVGALFTSDLVTDTFAVDFAKQYLAKNIKVAFYRKDSGINATNFTGEDKQSVLAFIHPNSRFVKTGFDNEYIQLPNGKRFIVRNIIFPGVETSPGGMLVFVPLGNQLHQKIIVVLPQLLFLFLALIFHSNAKKERKLHSFYYVLIATTIVLTFFAYLIYTYIGEGVIKIKDPVYPLYNSVLAFQPTVGVFDLHASQNINIVVNSGNENVNAFNTTVLYDPKLVEVSSISTKNSICTNIINQSLDQVTGKIHIECLVRNPGFSGVGGIIATLNIRGLKVGNASLLYSNDNQVLANDGLGTEVLRTVTNASFQYTDQLTRSSAILFSPSHPDMANWYANNQITVAWVPNVPAKISITDDSGRIEVFPSEKTPFTYTAPRDGIYSFKLEAGKLSGKNINLEYTAKVDLSLPDKTLLRASQTQVKRNNIVRFSIIDGPDLSGLQSTHYVRVDDDLFYPTGKDFYVPFIERGKHIITLRTFDTAGNYADKQIEIQVIE